MANRISNSNNHHQFAASQAKKPWAPAAPETAAGWLLSAAGGVMVPWSLIWPLLPEAGSVAIFEPSTVPAVPIFELPFVLPCSWPPFEAGGFVLPPVVSGAT